MRSHCLPVRQCVSLARPTLLLFALCLASVGGTLAQTPTETLLHTFNAYADGTHSYGTLIQASDGNFYGTTSQGGTNNFGTVFRYSPAKSQVTTIHSFVSTDGSLPHTGLMQGKDGMLYGTVSYGGAIAYYGGAIFRMNTDGSAFTLLHSFNNIGTGGSFPLGSLIQGSDGYLYGTTYYGGTQGNGALFRLSTDGTSYTVIHSFNANATVWPIGPLIQGSDGYLYGTSDGNEADASSYGAVYKVKPDGSLFTILHTFSNSDGALCNGGVILGSDGALYGTASKGGANNDGTVFRITTDGKTFTKLYTFGGSDGSLIQSGVVQGSDGKLYGTAYQGGANSDGDVYRLNLDGTGFTLLHSFSGNDGANPYAGLVQGSDGRLYGTTQNGAGDSAHSFGTLFSIDTAGAAFTSEFSFSNGVIDGQRPGSGSLIADKHGNWYGTTSNGGFYGMGILYAISHTGTETILYEFNTTDGAAPAGGVIADAHGNLYGTTTYGGSQPGQKGTIFEYSPATGAYTVLYSFGGSDGAAPSSSLTLVGSTLYGTTYVGGKSNNGVVFQFTLPTATKPGVYTLLHSFAGMLNDDGANPLTPLIWSNGTLYGTTYKGGSQNEGTVFKILASSGVVTLLHSFSGSDGAYPDSGLTSGGDGYLYGMTINGGPQGYGALYRISPSGKNFGTVLLFGPSATYGDYPTGSLILGSDSYLYGTSLGTVFQISRDGKSAQVIHTFNAVSGTDGWLGNGVTEGSDGNLYGATSNGGLLPYAGVNVQGTVFQLETLLPIITSFAPAKGPVGATVTVNGVNLAGATVTIGSVAQTVVSNTASKLVIQVAAGTKSGPIAISVKTGTTASTKSFIVTP